MTKNAISWRVARTMPLIDGESLDGYVARVAAFHHLPNNMEITRLAGATWSSRPNASLCEDDELDGLAECLRMDVAALRYLAPRHSDDRLRRNFLGFPINRRLLQFKTRRFSPTSLGTSAHHRALWTLRCFPFCEESWEFLVDRCPNSDCAAVQRWYSSPGIALCDRCAEPLTRAVAESVPEGLRPALREAVGLVHPDLNRRTDARRVISLQLKDLEAGDLLDLLCALAVVIDPTLQRRMARRSLDFNNDYYRITAAIGQAWPLLCNWPEGLTSLMAQRINEGSVGRGDGNRGASLRFMSLGGSIESSPAVAAVIAQFVEERRAACEHGYLARAAVKITGATITGLVAKRREGKIPTILGYRGERLFPLFDKIAIDGLAAEREPRERLARAAAYLGLPSYSLLELVRSGLIDASKIPPGRSTALNVSKKSLESFADGVLDRTTYGDKEDWILISDAMNYFGRRLKPWAAVLCAIKSGKFVAAIVSNQDNPKSGIAGRLTIPRENMPLLASYHVDPQIDWENEMITIAEAGEVLNLDYLATMTALGLCPGQRTYRHVAIPRVLEASDKFISSKEASLRLGIKPQAFSKIARTCGVRKIAPAIYCREGAERSIAALHA